MAKIIRPISTGANKVIRNTTIAAITINAITPMIIAPIVPNLIFNNKLQPLIYSWYCNYPASDKSVPLQVDCYLEDESPEELEMDEVLQWKHMKRYKAVIKRNA